MEGPGRAHLAGSRKGVQGLVTPYININGRQSAKYIGQFGLDWILARYDECGFRRMLWEST